jgi:integrase
MNMACFVPHRQLNIPVVFVGLWQKFLQIGWTWLVTVHIPNLLLQGLGTKPHQFHGIRVGMDGGFGLDRVQVFLLNSLKQSTIDKYTKALQHLSNELADQQLVWSDTDEEDQDKFVAEWLLSGYEAGHHRAEYGWALSAVQKVCPRVRLRTSWKVYDAWGQKEPPKQAPAAPPELLHAMFAVALLLNRPALAALMVSCYAGLLRVREALALRQQDVVLQATEVILCLGQTKRGLEQKVVMRNPSVVAFFMQYFKRFPVSHGEPVFSISYSSALRWVKRLAFLLGCDDLSLTTHTFRRSGASELARQGLPLADILLYGRWSTERSAREYIRQGEVGIVRARQQLQPVTAARIQQWASINRSPWAVYDKLFKFKSITVNVEQVTVARFHEFEGAIFNTFQSEGVVGRQ